MTSEKNLVLTLAHKIEILRAHGIQYMRFEQVNAPDVLYVLNIWIDKDDVTRSNWLDATRWGLLELHIWLGY